MLLLLIVVLWGILVALGEGDLPSFSGPHVTENPGAQADFDNPNNHNSSSEPISAAPVNSSDASVPLTLVWGGADEAYLDQSPILVTVDLMGQQALGTLTLEILVPPEYFHVQDMGEQDGIQVQPGEMAVAVVNQNEVNVEGLLRYQVVDLGESDTPMRTILTLSLIPVATGLAEVYIQTAAAIAPAGEWLDMGIPQPSKLIEIHAATAVATPVPTAVPVEVTETGAGELAAGIYYRIRQGENLFRLALRFGSTAEEIAAVNGITEMYSVPAEMVLRIPVPPPQGRAAYVVTAGETLYEIARAFDLAVETLAAWNGIFAPYHIQEGRWLVLHPLP